MKELKDFMRERKTTSGFVLSQVITRLLGPMRSEMSSRPRVGVIVSRLGTPPSAGMT